MDICNEKLSSTCIERFFGIKIDNKLTLEEHVERLCKKASQKVNAVARISSLMRFEQRKRMVNLFIISHFSHYPLVWMFHSRRINNRIDHVHERALKVIYQDYNFSFKELLILQNSQENTCARAFLLITLHHTDVVWHKYKKALYSTSIL